MIPKFTINDPIYKGLSPTETVRRCYEDNLKVREINAIEEQNRILNKSHTSYSYIPCRTIEDDLAYFQSEEYICDRTVEVCLVILALLFMPVTIMFITLDTSALAPKTVLMLEIVIPLLYIYYKERTIKKFKQFKDKTKKKDGN